MESQSKPHEAQRPGFVLEKLCEPGEQAGGARTRRQAPLFLETNCTSRLEFPALEKKG